MRNVHFSRNPKIAAFLKDYGYVKEFGEGVDRMCAELTGLGLPDPEYEAVSFMLRCTVRAAEVREQGADADARLQDTPASGDITPQKSREKSREKNSDRLLALLRQKATVTTDELATTLDLSRAGVEKIIRTLKKAGRLRRVGPDNGGHWEIVADAKEEK